MELFAKEYGWTHDHVLRGMTMEQVFLYAARLRDRMKAMSDAQSQGQPGRTVSRPVKTKSVDELMHMFPASVRRIRKSSDN